MTTFAIYGFNKELNKKVIITKKTSKNDAIKFAEGFVNVHNKNYSNITVAKISNEIKF